VKRPNGLSIEEEMENYGMTADVYRRARGDTQAKPAEQPRSKPAPKAKAEHFGWQSGARRDEDSDWLKRGAQSLERAFGEERRQGKR